MLFSSSRPFVAILILVSAHFTTAALTLSSLQSIAGFSDKCTQAYQNPINACPDASSFIKPSSSPCTKDCLLALISAGASIQQACQLQTANRGTVIGQAFVGNLAQWLCTGENTGDGNAATTLTASNIMASTASTSNSATSSASSSVSTSTATSMKTSASVSSSSVSQSAASSSASTSGSSTSSDAQTTSTSISSTISHSTTSAATSKSSASRSTSSKSSSSTSARASTTSIDSTPFDQTVNAARSLKSWSGTSEQAISYLFIGLGLAFFGI